MLNENELSDKQIHLLGEEKLGKVPKLILDLHDKEKYVIHNELLEYYIKLGMKVTKVYRTISFNEEAWLKPYIDFNTNMRKNATSNFKKDLWKLMNNAFYGKTLENIRNRINLELVSSEERAIKLFSKSTFKDRIIFNENFIAITKTIPTIKFDKPIYTGMCILDYSKLTMYKFYYDIFCKRFPNNQVIASDTDSMFINIFTEDLYKDLEDIKEELDTSNYPIDHPLYSEKNKKVINKFKDEVGGKVISEINFIRSKAYSFITIDKSDQFYIYKKNNQLDEYYDLIEQTNVVKKVKRSL